MSRSLARSQRRAGLREKAKRGDLYAHAQLSRRDCERRLIAMRPRLEAAYPTRAQAVQAYIDLVLDPPESNRQRVSKAADIVQRQGKPPESRRPGQNRRQFKRESWHRPDKDEQVVREIARRWREERLNRKERGDGDISGLLAVAAELGAEQIQQAHPELAGEEHYYALTEWFYGVWGLTLHRFQPDMRPSAFLDRHDERPAIAGYREWRQPKP